MGSGFKDFAVNEVLTSSDVDEYLMKQTVMSFASAASRDSTLAAYLQEGMVAYLQDVDRITCYTGSAWIEIAYGSSWATYTPAWTSSGTAPAIGNGTLSGRYTRQGKSVTFHAGFTAGTTTTFGTGGYSLSLPFQAAAVGVECFIPLRTLDASGPTAYMGLALIQSNATTCLLHVQNGANFVSCSGTAPFTYATSDYIRVQGTYEAA